MPLAVVLREEQLLLGTARGVLRADEALALNEAASLLKFAHEEARRVREAADEAARQLHATSAEDARRRAEAEVAAALAQAHLQAASLMREVEGAIAETVVQAFERVAAGIDRAALLAQTLAEVRQLVDARHLAVLKVAPADLAVAADGVARLIGTAQLPATFAVHADPTLSPGTCVLQSAAGLYTFGLAQQLRAMSGAADAWLRHVPPAAVAAVEPAPAVPAHA